MVEGTYKHIATLARLIILETRLVGASSRRGNTLCNVTIPQPILCLRLLWRGMETGFKPSTELRLMAQKYVPKCWYFYNKHSGVLGPSP